MNALRFVILASATMQVSALMVKKTDDAQTPNMALKTDDDQSPKNLVYDVGMNTGADSASYLKKGFKVVAIEANPVLAAENAGKFAKEIADKRLTIVNKAVGPKAGEKVEFYVPDLKGMAKFQAQYFPSTLRKDILIMDEMASMSKETACNKTGFQCGPQSSLCNCKELKVDVTTCTDLIKKHGAPYYMKVDIEGFDGLCVKDLVNVPCNMLPDYLSWEDQSVTWEGYGKAGSSQDFLKLLEKKGYTQTKVIAVPIAKHGGADYKNDDGSGGFAEEAVDYHFKSKQWGDVGHAMDKATPKCYYPNGKLEMMCDVHVKLDRTKCKSK